MNRLLRAHNPSGELDRTICDHFVRVHVRLRAGAGLKYNERKLVVPLSVDYFLRGSRDQVRFLWSEHPELAIHEHGAFFQNSERANYRPAPSVRFDSDREIMTRTFGLRPPEMVAWNFYFAE